MMVRGSESVAQRLFTVEEYHRMAETGILGSDERVELVRGVVREMSPKNWAHVIPSKFITTGFAMRFGAGQASISRLRSQRSNWIRSRNQMCWFAPTRKNGPIDRRGRNPFWRSKRRTRRWNSTEEKRRASMRKPAFPSTGS